MIEQRVTTRDDWPRELIELLDHQQSLVDQLSSLACRQRDLIGSGQTDQLLTLLAERQQLIDEITSGQGRVADLTGRFEQQIDDLNEGSRDRIQTIIEEIGCRLNEIMQRDAEDQKALEARCSDRKKEVAGLDTARQARRAYLNARSVNNRFSDQRG
jgi:hypothetical protein